MTNINLTLQDMEKAKHFQPHGDNTQFSLPVATNNLYPISGGGLDNYKSVEKFGRVLAYGTSIVDVTDLPTPAVYTWLQSAVQLEAISSSLNDDAGGTGAITIVVEGLDADFLEVSAIITMNGTAATTATTQTFLRVHRAYVATCGTYNSTTAGPNIGNITIRTKTAGATHIYLAAAVSPVGQSFAARYTIPAGWTGYLNDAKFTATAVKASDFYLIRRENADTVAAPFSAKRLIDVYYGVIAFFHREWKVPLKLPEKTDIWASVIGAGTGSDASVAFDILLVKNET